MTTKNGETKETTGFTSQQRTQVVAAFVVFLNTWGLILAFGAFQTYYERELLKTRSSSDISWISTVCGFLVLGSGLVTGVLFDHGYYRVMFMAGTILQTAGLMTLSVSTQYYQVFLSQGICVGLGGGMLYIPGIAAAATSFDVQVRPKVMGVVASGAGIGGVIYPIAFRQLVPQVGFGWTVRIIAFIIFATYILAWSVFIFTQPKPILVRKWIDWSAFRDFPFVCLAAGAFLSSVAYIVPPLYLPLYASLDIPEYAQSDRAFYLLAILNGVSVPGRLLTGAIGAKHGPLETCAVGVLCCTIVLFSWPAVHTSTGVIIWTVFWGLASSVIVALPGAFIPLFCPSIAVVGTRSGMYWVCSALGILIGGPIGGVLIDAQDGIIKWWHMQVLAGCFMAAVVVVIIPPVLHLRKQRQRQLME